MRTALSVLMMLAFAVPVNAQMTSAMLARLCSQEGKPGRAMCETYIAGLAEGILAQKTLLCNTVFDCGPAIEKEGTFCLPEHTVTFEQMAEIFLQHEKSRKPKKNGLAALEFLTAMKNAYPCPGTDKK
jgi:hypothetical protein